MVDLITLAIVSVLLIDRFLKIEPKRLIEKFNLWKKIKRYLWENCPWPSEEKLREIRRDAYLKIIDSEEKAQIMNDGRFYDVPEIQKKEKEFLRLIEQERRKKLQTYLKQDSWFYYLIYKARII